MAQDGHGSTSGEDILGSPSEEDICDHGSDSRGGSPLGDESLPSLLSDDVIEGSDSPDLFADENELPCAEPSKWVPGSHVAPWIGRHAHIKEQAQVLLTNVVTNVQSLPRSLVRMIKNSIPEVLSAGRLPFAMQVAAHLLGMSVGTVAQVFHRVRANSWQPTQDATDSSPPQTCNVVGGLSPQQDNDENEKMLRNVLRVVLGNAAEGGSYLAYVRDLHRMRLAGAEVGTNLGSRHFPRHATALASLVLQQLDGFDFNSHLGGLGIPSDFSMLADAVSIGLEVRARHDVLLIICLCIVSRTKGNVYTPMHSGPAMPFGSHGGEAMASLMLQALASHPASWGLRSLQVRCASVCGDGALCEGGPEHRHSSTAAAEKLWRRIHTDVLADFPPSAAAASPPALSQSGEAACPPPVCTVWDPFHRADLAAWRAIRSVPLAVKAFDVAKQLDALLGQSEGVLLFRGVAAHLREPTCNIRAPGGTRKVGYLAGTPGSVLENYRTIVASMHARAKWVQQGHSSQSLGHILDVSRTLSDVSFLTFLLVLSDILTLLVRPFTLQVQGMLEPSELARAELRLATGLGKALKLLPSVRCLFRVIALCRQHAAQKALATLLGAFRFSPMGRCFPRLFDAAAGILCQSPHFKHVELSVVTDFDAAKTMCLGPHCQCLAREEFHRANWGCLGYSIEDRRAEIALTRHNGLIGVKRVMVPLHVRTAETGQVAWQQLPPPPPTS